jgi:hypothetical protein
MDEDTHGCDSCSSTWKDCEHRCIDCDYQMCAECYEERLVLNPKHRLEQINGQQLEAAVIPTIELEPPTANSIIDTKKTFIDQRGSLCCNTCFNYTPDFIRPGWQGSPEGLWYRRREKPISEFKTSADKGCDLCSIVYRAVATAISRVLATDTAIFLNIYRHMLTISISGFEREFPNTIKIHTMQGHRARWSTLETAEVLSNSLRDAQTFEKMKVWLRHCEIYHSHPKCKEMAEAKLPRRLIAIKIASGHLELRLKEFNGEIGRYIALSHCWGGFTGCQTTLANYRTKIKGIDYEDLPQTFKDAIYCAIQLEVAYVWIDSLCIIQDDAKDWEHESSLMSDVYSNAWLVLAAVSAGADSEGFLIDPIRLYRGVGLESCAGSGDFDLVIHHDMPHPGFARGGKSSNGPEPLSPVNVGPLGTRAWTLQETLLARRCIGFNEYEIVWECQSTNACECGLTEQRVKEEDFDGPVWVYREATGLMGAEHPSILPRPLSRLHDFYSTVMEWRQLIIPNYVRRSLTVPGDKLPALSGLASIIAESFGDRYLAGIWLSDISFGLAWHVNRDRRQPARVASTVPLGPSFSWVSVDDIVRYRLPNPQRADGTAMYGSVAVTVLDYDILLSGTNPYGSVLGGWLKLSALTHDMQLHWNSAEEVWTLVNLSVHEAHSTGFYPDTVLCGINTYGPEGQNISVQRSMKNWNEPQSFSAYVTGVLLVNTPKIDGYQLKYRDIQRLFTPHEIALLILSKSTSSDQRFTRIGLGVVAFESLIAERWIESAERKELVIE